MLHSVICTYGQNNPYSYNSLVVLGDVKKNIFRTTPTSQSRLWKMHMPRVDLQKLRSLSPSHTHSHQIRLPSSTETNRLISIPVKQDSVTRFTQHTSLLLFLLRPDAVLTPAAALTPARTRPATSSPDILQERESS